MKPDGGSAFPRAGSFFQQCEKLTFDAVPQAGMSLRDWFAGMVLEGIVANKDYCDEAIDNWEIAKYAYELADAMIAERTKE